ncbi:hypothetical protein ACFFMM_22490 [Micromonospora chaiyaphumensis]|uniref:DUF3558 domain-containing protein n=1 Tax=Micromonospora chaiyaphumensis TaxID=307119 RepID=A0A1C4U6L3_9ACTN|nr:hypothetical protein [Micromonospora chaiyaphumensis]SCE67350.1 hypothetical protein GA0070214_101399 [Micromonospora chaiyaphumensis]
MARHTLPPARTGARPRTVRAARLGVLPLLLLALLGPAACDDAGDTPTAGPAGVDAGAGDDTTGGDDAADLAGGVRPPCPFTAAQVSDLLGQPMKDQGNCLFGDGKGVASLTVTTSSTMAGKATFDYQHEQAGKQYERVVDLDRGDQSYLAAKDVAGEAVLISGKGSYTLTLSSIGTDVAGYEQTLRRLLDAIPA